MNSKLDKIGFVPQILAVALFSLLVALLISHRHPIVAPAQPTSGALIEKSEQVVETKYVVRRGDWLSKIASQFGTDWRTLAALNDLKSPYILQVGQVLVLPGSNAEQIARYILTLKALTPTEAAQLASHYAFLCNKYEIDPKVFVSIAFQENAFRRSGITNNDIGHFQINYVHQVINRNLDYTIQELDENWKLNAQLAAKYLRECMPKSKIEPRWSCFNSLTPGTETEPGPQRIYAAAVQRHLTRLK